MTFAKISLSSERELCEIQLSYRTSHTSWREVDDELELFLPLILVILVILTAECANSVVYTGE